jgi:parvulin-like peptidyl-prolyl isomerase
MKEAAGSSGAGRSPERRPAYVRRNFYLLCSCLTILVFLAAGLSALLFLEIRSPYPGEAKHGYAEARRDLAGKLLSAGLSGKAIEQYELYLSEAELPADRRAKIAYTLGTLCMEEGDYEDALGWLYQVEMLDPKSELAPEAGSKIVACLERLGRFAQAQYSLEARSGLDKGGRREFKAEEVVARIGDDVITRGQLDEAIDAMPEWMRSSLEDTAQRKAFLEQYVAEELLYRKAKRLELDRDPWVRRQSERAARQLMVQKVLEDEMKARGKVSDDDAELYYRANKDRYAEKEAFKVRMIKVETGQLEGIRQALEQGQDFAGLAKTHSRDEATRATGGEVTDWIEEGLDPTGIGDPSRLWQALANRGKGEVTEPIQVDEDAYIFQITAHRPPRGLSLEEAKKQVQLDLTRERAEKAYKELIRQSLQASDVKLFPERLGEAARKDTPAGPPVKE